MRALLAATLLVATTGFVRAEELPPVPPPIIAPAPPPQWTPGVDFDQELAARGHRKKVAGGLLIGFGSAVLAAGQALAIYAALTPRKVVVLDFCNGCSTSRYDTAEIAGGVVMALVGAAATLAGIPVYAVGGAQARKAEQRLQLRASAGGLRLEF